MTIGNCTCGSSSCVYCSTIKVPEAFKSTFRDWRDTEIERLTAEVERLKLGLECTHRSANDLIKDNQRLRDALEELVSFTEKQICTHDETYRGGAIWEICSSCGMKWADDEGGKPEYVTPKEITEAIEALEVEGE